MGGRLSAPRGPAGTTEASRVLATNAQLRSVRYNPRMLLVPFGVITLGGLFFVYSRTTIHAAKENAKRAREADGGSINWRNEGLRQRGVLDKPEERSLWKQLFSGGDSDDASKDRREKENKRLEMQRKQIQQTNPIEEGIRRAREGRGRGGEGNE